MTTDTKQKCVSCEEVFEDGDHTYSNVKDGVLCYGCQEDDLQSASSLVLVHGAKSIHAESVTMSSMTMT
jgi:hypothetical protein